jgi:hypothetical protein
MQGETCTESEDDEKPDVPVTSLPGSFLFRLYPGKCPQPHVLVGPQMEFQDFLGCK